MKLTSEEIIEDYLDLIEKDYPNYTRSSLKTAIKAPFHFMKSKMRDPEDWEDIRFPFLGVMSPAKQLIKLRILSVDRVIESIMPGLFKGTLRDLKRVEREKDKRSFLIRVFLEVETKIKNYRDKLRTQKKIRNERSKKLQ